MPRYLLGWLSLLAVSLSFFAAAGTARAEGEEEEPPPPLAYSPPSGVVEPSFPEGQPSCPSLEVPPYEGTDDSAQQIRALRVESAESCAAVVGRLDRVRERAFWSASELFALRRGGSSDGEFMSAQLAEVLQDLEVTNQTLIEKGVFVKGLSGGGGGEELAEVVEAVDAGAEASKLALWVLVGVCLAQGIGMAIWRTGALRS